MENLLQLFKNEIRIIYLFAQQTALYIHEKKQAKEKEYFQQIRINFQVLF